MKKWNAMLSTIVELLSTLVVIMNNDLNLMLIYDALVVFWLFSWCFSMIVADDCVGFAVVSPRLPFIICPWSLPLSIGLVASCHCFQGDVWHIIIAAQLVTPSWLQSAFFSGWWTCLIEYTCLVVITHGLLPSFVWLMQTFKSSKSISSHELLVCR